MYLGIDFGTSGARAIVIDSQQQIVATAIQPSTDSSDLAKKWRQALFNLLGQIPITIRQQLEAIAIDGTSATVLLGDRAGNPIASPILYNDSCGGKYLEQIRAIAPGSSVALSPTSSLVKLWWYTQQPNFEGASFLLHQADWLAGLLHHRWGISDYHNALKLGYDVKTLSYPDWLLDLPISPLLPQVLAPGTPVAPVATPVAQQWQINPRCWVCTGTTDSIAAFIASGATNPGEAVTSLGSTLVIKLLSQTPVESAQYGVYSHRWGDLWLTGGASNTGGAVLKHYFTDTELKRLSKKIDPTRTSPLNYYPLLGVGDRFPINDSHLQPQLQPIPNDPVAFLHGLLQGIARIEALGYQRLQELGATPLTKVYTAGGGAKNQVWSQIRQNRLQTPVVSSFQTEAAYGTAILAYQGSKKLFNQI